MEQVNKETKKVAVVGNKTTEGIIGSAALKLAQANKLLAEAYTNAMTINQVIEEGTLKVTTIEDKIVSLTTELQQAKAKKDFDLNLYVKESEDKFGYEWLNKRNLTALPTDELNKKNSEIARLSGDLTKEINSAVHAATGSMKKDHDTAISMKDMQFKMQEADNIAKIKQLEEQNAFLKLQVEAGIKQLDAERAASVERSKANAIGTLTVGQK